MFKTKNKKYNLIKLGVLELEVMFESVLGKKIESDEECIQFQEWINNKLDSGEFVAKNEQLYRKEEA